MFKKVGFRRILVFLLLITALIVSAFSPLQETIPSEAPFLESVLQIVFGFSAFGGMISVIVNLLKSLRILPDKTSFNIFGAANLLLFIAVSAFELFNIPVSYASWNEIFGVLSTVLTSVLKLIAMFGGGALAHNSFKGFWGIGASYSEEKGFLLPEKKQAG